MTMRTMRRPVRRLAGAAALLSLAGAAALVGLAATRTPPPAETTAGKFEGTWYRVDPENRQAVQFRRSENGRGWDLRFYWRSADGFEIDTDWASRHTFTYKGFPGVLVLNVDPKLSNESRVTVHYRRDQDGASASHLTEEGDLILYRTGDGRLLVWLQDPLKIDTTVAEPIAPYEEDGAKRDEQRLWQFGKVSKRLILWDEIPW